MHILQSEIFVKNCIQAYMFCLKEYLGKLLTLMIGDGQKIVLARKCKKKTQITFMKYKSVWLCIAIIEIAHSVT